MTHPFKLDSLFKKIEDVTPTIEELDKSFQNIRESIQTVEFEPLPPALKYHFGLDGPEFDNVKLRRQFSVETIATLGFAKRSLSFLHGAQNVVLHSKHKTSLEGKVIFDKLANITKNFLRELEAARETFKEKGKVKEFEAKQFQHYLYELNRVLSQSIGKDYHKTYADLLKAEQLACWHQRETIATFNHYDKTARLIIERPMVTEKVAKKKENGLPLYPFSEYMGIPAARFDNYSSAPEWFRELKPLQQNWLIAHRQELIDGKLGCPPSILRYVPGVANFAEHNSYIKAKSGVHFRKTYRHSTARPIDMKKGTERDRLRDANGLQIVKTIDPIATFNNFWNIKADQKSHLILEKIPPFVGKRSLLTPFTIFDSIFSYKENNGDLAKDDLLAIKKGVEQFNKEQTAATSVNNNAAAKSNESVKPIEVDKLTINWSINGERGANNPFDKEHFEADKKLLTNVATLLKIFQVSGLSNKEKESFDAVINYISDCDPFNRAQLLKEQEIDKFEISNRNDAFNNVSIVLLDENYKLNFAKNLGLVDADTTILDEEATEKLKKITTAIQIAIQAARKLAELWYDKKLNKVVEGVNPLGRNRRLFAVGYEDLILQCLGAISLLVCKSSRDRVGTAKIHTSAMERCYRENGFLPGYYDKDPERKIFTKLTAEEFINGHQQAWADGGLKDGTSTLNVVQTEPMLPKDIQEQIEEMKPNYLEAQNVLAKTNKPKIEKNPYAPRPWYEKVLVFAAAAVNILGGVIVALGMLGIIALGWPVTIPLMIMGIISALVMLHATGTLKNNIIKTDAPIVSLGIGAGLTAVGLLLHHLTLGISSLAAIAVINVTGFIKTMFDFRAPGRRRADYKTGTLGKDYEALNVAIEGSSIYQTIVNEYYNNQIKEIMSTFSIKESTLIAKKDKITDFFKNNNQILTKLVSGKNHVTVNDIAHLEALLKECFMSSNDEIRQVGLELLKCIPSISSTTFESVINKNLPSLHS